MYCIYVYRFRSLSYMLVFAHMVQYFKVLWSCFSIRILGYPVFLTDLYEREREAKATARQQRVQDVNEEGGMGIHVSQQHGCIRMQKNMYRTMWL